MKRGVGRTRKPLLTLGLLDAGYVLNHLSVVLVNRP